MEMFPASENSNWDNMFLSMNSNLTWEVIENTTHLGFMWDLHGISANPNMTLDIIQNHTPPGCWDALGLSKNINITWEYVLNNLNLNWYMFILSFHPNITLDIIDSYPHPPCGDWSWARISRNPNLTLEYVLAHPDVDWDWNALCETLPLTWDIVMECPEFDLTISHIQICLAKNKSLPIEIFIENSNIFTCDWTWMMLSSREDLTWDIVRSNPSKAWCWYNLAINPSFTWNDIQEMMDTIEIINDSEWGIIAANPNITWEIFNSPDFPDKCRVIESFCSNPNLTWEIVADNPELGWKKYLNFFSINTFGKS